VSPLDASERVSPVPNPLQGDDSPSARHRPDI
jgi:hypothetical protein